MRGLGLVTWNVLHRVHAENWEEPAIDLHLDDEPGRIAGVTARVAALLAADHDVVCLQEVSGDQLASLRAVLPEGTQLVVLRYPRVPAPRAGATHQATLADPGEHLVTVVAAGRTIHAGPAAAFDDDPGKGYLTVDVASDVAAAPAAIRIVNTHVTYGSRAAGQLARLAVVATAGPAAAVVAGDFNADRAAVAAGLGAGVAARRALAVAVPPAPALPTRPRATSDKSQDIDHVVALGLRPLACAVLAAGGLSDHNLVEARLDPEP
ncbi:MAG: endonuclease/exonuclease/phosphatase family protein [Myxococcales bacterium]|nr:endonuclease/exonuclease/phosphatase family protein [Myxococcales bacterium]